jgi:hypothetical protein
MQCDLNTPSQNTSHYSTEKQATPDYKVLQRLRQSCRVTLERYVDVVSQTTSHLAALTPGSFDPLGRANLALLKQKEDRAHEVYLKARVALINYIAGENEPGKSQ